MDQSGTPDAVFCMHCGPGTALRADVGTGSLRCPACGSQTPRPAFPLLVVAGVSGSGKTAVLDSLRSRLTTCEIFDVDLILHVAALGWDVWRNTWLQLAGAIAANGRPSLLSGTFTPDQLEQLPARILIGPIHFCLLDAPPDVIAARLRDRPRWRGCTEDFIRAQEGFAAELRRQIGTVFDTHTLGITETADAVAGWATTVLEAENAVR
ncbi:MAG TPA: hypothetical protein VHC49_19650 [Mycobacteriales bacterium]|nr:hypothetical protein [Mycobacteriales bacterium]